MNECTSFITIPSTITAVKVTKSYRGDMTMVGECVAVTGVMRTTDTVDNTDREVGYFNMIDATDERTGGTA
jgi:hypothetical protein